MRPWIRPLLVLILLIILPFPALSVIIETTDGKVYRGYLVRKNSVSVTFRPDGAKKEKTLSLRFVKRVTAVVEAERLKALKPGDIKLYYRYARELAGKSVDPEARDMALRLFLIAAYHKPAVYGFDSLYRMSEIGRNDNEKRTFKAMAFLLKLVGGESMIKKTSGELKGGATRDAFLRALESLRRGKTKDAKLYAKKEGVKDYFAVIPGLMTYREFLQHCETAAECSVCVQGRVQCANCAGNLRKRLSCPKCNAKGWVLCKKCTGAPRRVKLSTQQMMLILQLQLLNEQSPSADFQSAETTKTTSWARLLGPNQIRPVPVLSLRHLTEFDPQKSVYKDGDWVEAKK